MAALGAVERLERAVGHRTPLDDTRWSSATVKRPRATAATLPPPQGRAARSDPLVSDTRCADVLRSAPHLIANQTPPVRSDVPVLIAAVHSGAQSSVATWPTSTVLARPGGRPRARTPDRSARTQAGRSPTRARRHRAHHLAEQPSDRQHAHGRRRRSRSHPRGVVRSHGGRERRQLHGCSAGISERCAGRADCGSQPRVRFREMRTSHRGVRCSTALLNERSPDQ